MHDVLTPRVSDSMEEGTIGAAAGGAAAAGGHGASPVARRTAARLGVKLASVVGTGPRGRILKSDVALAARRAPAAASAVSAPAPEPERGVTVEEPTRAQALIARRMAESRATVPEFAIQVDVDMTDALELRARLKEIAAPAPSLNDIVVKACASALQHHPRANGSYRDGRFELHDAVNVGIAVAAPDTLAVPVVRDADSKSLGAIAAESRRLAERVRSREITPPELSGGTFTVSNLGMFGIDRFEGVIDVPQAAILCVGAVRERPIVRDGQVVPAPTMTLTLVCDHRILYGADAAAFLRDVRRALEQPLSVVL
jgi:pyruvate dehydrogenase E2 component (dihydrolipoamide acetyltransferase)